MQKALTVGPLPALHGHIRSAADQAHWCALRKRASSAITPRPLPAILPSGGAAAYVVYAVGLLAYGEPEGLYASVDFGNSWIPLSGANSSSPSQGLGDSPVVLEASQQDPGVLLVGTGGRGGFFRNVTLELLHALRTCSV